MNRMVTRPVVGCSSLADVVLGNLLTCGDSLPINVGSRAVVNGEGFRCHRLLMLVLAVNSASWRRSKHDSFQIGINIDVLVYVMALQ